MDIKLQAASRLLATPSNSQGSIQSDVVDQLKRAKYQVTMKGGLIQVHNGSPSNVAALLKHSGWIANPSKTVLNHSQLDYRIKLREAKGITSVQVLD